jgi:hypothetical protein
MLNVVAVQAEIEYRQQRLLQEAAEERRARQAVQGRRHGRRLRSPKLRVRRSSAHAA